MISVSNKFRMMSVLVALAMLFSFANVSPASAAAANPESCQDILEANSAAPDGDYVIYPNNQVFTVYCNDMVGTPSEYLTLANTGGGSNFSQMTASGGIPQLVTHYTKVRLDPVSLLVDINDKTFSSTTGYPGYQVNPWNTVAMDYATGVDCPYPYAQTGRGNIDLRGTPFAVNTTFLTDGWLPSAGSAAFSADDQVVDLQGGGFCGWISPGGTDSWVYDQDAYVLSLQFNGPSLSNVAITDVNENGEATLTGNMADVAPLGNLTLDVDWDGDGSTDNSYGYSAGTTSFSVTHQYLDDNPSGTPSDSYTVYLTLTNDDGFGGIASTMVNVTNMAPTLGAISVDAALVPVNTSFNASANFTDPGTFDTHTASWDWGDGTSAGTVTQGAGSGSVNDSHSYSTPGVYTVKLAVADDDGGESDESVYQYVVVYDPSAGFVTGGGWINSPAGAYAANPGLTGKANFGFVAKYERGQSTPDGNTQFQFKAGNLNFHSTSYEWLVVAGARAKFRGVGTINGQGSYSFMITATDGNLLGGGQSDGFRIKIQDAGGVVYDNKMGDGDDSDATTDLGGGSIVIHNR